MSKEAMKLALEALETSPMSRKSKDAIDALREALEQPAQKCSYPYCGCNSKAWCKVERNEALDKKAENARELGLDYEQAQQAEPVAYIRVSKTGHVMACAKTGDFFSLPHKTLLYTSPPAQRTWVGLIRGVRVEGDTVVIAVKGGNDAARELCGALLEEKNT